MSYERLQKAFATGNEVRFDRRAVVTLDAPSPKPEGFDRRQAMARLAEAQSRLNDAGESSAGYIAVAQLEAALGLEARAERTWRAALRLEISAQATAGLGAILFRRGRTGDALHLFAEALRIDPDNDQIMTSVSAAHLYLGDHVAARRYAARALQIDPENREARLCRARSDIALGAIETAESDLTILRKAGYKPDELRQLHVHLLTHHGEHESAVFLAAELCERYPASGECLAGFRRAFAAFQERDSEDRLAEFLDAMESAIPAATPRQRSAATREMHETVDVLIPVHNAPAYVAACVDAVLGGDTDRLGKLILIDDCSGPDTTTLLQTLAARDPRVHVVTLAERQGFTRAIRAGLAESDAKSFVALNSDTLVPRDWLTKLLTALRSDPATAMVGPMSDNAAWQNIASVFDPQWNLSAHPKPDTWARQRIWAKSDHIGPLALIPVPMLHGFCVMVDRARYDAVEGLDQDAFPEGYGEVQDLSIRLRGAGHEVLVVADCVVFHERGASLTEWRRAALSLEARKTLYDRYSALNYLATEAACAFDLHLAAVRKAYAR